MQVIEITAAGIGQPGTAVPVGTGNLVERSVTGPKIALNAILDEHVAVGALSQDRISGLATTFNGVNAAIALKANDADVVKLVGAQTLTGSKTFVQVAPDAGQTVSVAWSAVPSTGGIQGFNMDRTNRNRPLGIVWTLNGVAEAAIGIDAGTNDLILYWSTTAPGDQIRVREGPHIHVSRSVGQPSDTYRFRIEAVALDPAAMVDLLYLVGLSTGPSTRLLRVANETTNLFSVLATGNVGIGTLAPTTLIQAVKSQDATTQFVLQNLTNGSASKASFRLQSDARSLFMESFATTFAAPLGGHSMVYTSTGADLALGAGNAERMRILATGEVQFKSDIEFTTNSKGPIMRDVNGARWRLTVGTDGILETAAA